MSGARASVPMLWLAVAVLLAPAWSLDPIWPLLPVAGMALGSGLWRLWFMRHLDRQPPEEAASLHRAERQVQANAALSGLMWSVATVWLMPHLSPPQAMLHVTILLGALCVASFYMSLIGRSFEWIVLPTAGSLIAVTLWSQPEQWPEIALGTSAFFVALMRGASHFRQTTLMALRQSLETAAVNEQLGAANRQLERDAAARARFLETMTHEIRRPMSGTIGALDLLAREPLTARQSRILEAARHSSAGLMHSLSEVLEYSALDTAPARMAPAPLSLGDWAPSMLQGHRPAAEAKGLRLDLTLSAALPAAVLADRARLNQLVDALLSNAVRFTDRGQVLLALDWSADRGLLIEVADSGQGLSTSDAAMVFEPFFQVDHGPQRAATGAGLGLTIAQRLARQMGGDILVDSVLGRGSRFTVCLPLVATQASPSPHQPADMDAKRPLQGTVLVVDDDAQNRLVAVEMLSRSGLSVLEAEDGLQALDLLHKGGIGLVLMDGQMPALDGYEATRRWREREQRLGTPRVPIIGISANAVAEHERLSQHAGMDDHLAKPFGMDELLSRVTPWLSVGPAPAH
ncbi:response regulator [Ideonella sp. 4Y16]|uniref:histidine kinase n=1 Tax=Ideonella alba TaxID=2824118 RepID=A0A941BFU6_9BURK|nr:ATP-binding protein [Ideonella alba]MBQ0931412.1 response regulator [Ideonella alba]MBQ0945000.1 response regulator [Ideonella alba]